MPETLPAKAGLDPEALSMAQVAELLGTSKKFVQRLRSRGGLPAPLNLGSQTMVRWSRATIERWIALGTPTRQEWDRLCLRK